MQKKQFFLFIRCDNKMIMSDIGKLKSDNEKFMSMSIAFK